MDNWFFLSSYVQTSIIVLLREFLRERVFPRFQIELKNKKNTKRSLNVNNNRVQLFPRLFATEEISQFATKIVGNSSRLDSLRRFFEIDAWIVNLASKPFPANWTFPTVRFESRGENALINSPKQSFRK